MGFIPEIQGWFNIKKTNKQNIVTYHIDKLEEDDHTIISIDADTALDKIPHPFMIKTLRKLGIEGNFNLI